MNKRATGVCFCFLSTILIVVKYISASIVFANYDTNPKGYIYTRDVGIYKIILEETPEITVFSLIFLVIGLIYIFLGKKE